MKTKLSLSLLLLSGAAWGLTIDWSTIDGGGGESAGGAYKVRGTIGQPDAGRMTGGTYAIEGGFWSMPEAIQAPGGPPLALTRSGNQITLSWPAPSTGWRLESSTDLLAWAQVSGTPVIVAGMNQLTQTLGARRFFRLTNL